MVRPILEYASPVSNLCTRTSTPWSDLSWNMQAPSRTLAPERERPGRRRAASRQLGTVSIPNLQCWPHVLQLPILEPRKRARLCTFYKFYQGLVQINTKHKLSCSRPGRSTLQSNPPITYDLPFHKTAYRKNTSLPAPLQNGMPCLHLLPWHRPWTHSRTGKNPVSNSSSFFFFVCLFAFL